MRTGGGGAAPSPPLSSPAVRSPGLPPKSPHARSTPSASERARAVRRDARCRIFAGATASPPASPVKVEQTSCMPSARPASARPQPSPLAPKFHAGRAGAGVAGLAAMQQAAQAAARDCNENHGLRSPVDTRLAVVDGGVRLSALNLQAPGSDRKRGRQPPSAPASPAAQSSEHAKRACAEHAAPYERVGSCAPDQCPATPSTDAAKCRASMDSARASATRSRAEQLPQECTPQSREAAKQRLAMQHFEAELQQRMARRHKNLLATFDVRAHPASPAFGAATATSFARAARHGAHSQHAGLTAQRNSVWPLASLNRQRFGSLPRLDVSQLEELAACVRSK